MKQMIMALSLLIVTSEVNAQIQPKIVYDLHKNSYVIADISTTSFSIRNFVVPVKAFGGTNTSTGIPVGGFKTGLEMMLTKVVASDSNNFFAGQKVFLNLDLAYLTGTKQTGQLRLFFGLGIK